MITVETATDIALAYRELGAAETLLAEVENQIKKDSFETKDLRDAFGRRIDGLQLGVPTGDSGHRLFNVQWKLAKPILLAHIANIKANLLALNERAISEQNLENVSL